jgi:hypothetical protein
MKNFIQHVDKPSSVSVTQVKFDNSVTAKGWPVEEREHVLDGLAGGEKIFPEAGVEVESALIVCVLYGVLDLLVTLLLMGLIRTWQ